MATEYKDIGLYIDSAKDLEERIARYDAILEVLETSALAAASKQTYEEYSLDDGQSKIKSVIRGATNIADSIVAFMRLRQLAVNKLNGRITNLVDARNFRRHGRY